jgi:hypothetical protein
MVDNEAVKRAVDKTAAFVANKGPLFEERLFSAERRNPHFVRGRSVKMNATHACSRSCRHSLRLRIRFTRSLESAWQPMLLNLRRLALATLLPALLPHRKSRQLPRRASSRYLHHLCLQHLLVRLRGRLRT